MNSVRRFIRKWLTAFFAPLRWSYFSGHFQSSILEKAVDIDGSPIPWLTYPCIDFLKTKDLSEAKILEFGGGQSTLWFSRKAEYVKTFDENPAWVEALSNLVPKNVDLVGLPLDRESHPNLIINNLSKSNQLYDVVIVDGLDRPRMFEIAISVLKSDGIIICDNSDQYGYLDIWKLAEGFNRVDFYGAAPGVIDPQCTSICFKDPNRFFRVTEKTHRRKWGGSFPH